MIGYLRGNIIDRGVGRLILEVSGVGYEVSVPASLDIGTNELELFVYTHVREDQISLFGFKSTDEVSFFKSLLLVSGVGPKVALAILGSASLESLKSSISKGDPSLLSAVPGVGKKTAEKAIIELRGKLGSLDFDGEFFTGSDSTEIIEALLGLGFQRMEAMEGLKSVPAEISSNDEKIKWLIKNLGKK